MINLLNHKTPKSNLHGSARFASIKDIKKMSILNNNGVYIGGYNHRGKHIYLRHDGPEHVLTFAPTRSGKGVGLIIPTLLSWEHSAVILDIKGENWDLTSGWRDRYAKTKCLRFEPSALEGSCKFNPLSEVRFGSPHCVKDIQNLTYMIVDPDGKGLNDHWSKTGHSLLVGIVLHAFDLKSKYGELPTLKYVGELLSNPVKSCDELFNEMLDSHNETVSGCARDMLNKSDSERSGVISTAVSFLSLYKDEIVANNTSRSDFKISELIHGDKPVSLYLVIPPADKDRLKPLIRLILNQIVRILCEKSETNSNLQSSKNTNRLLLLLDEFPTLGKMEILEESFSFIAGYGIKAFLVAQDLSQLRKHYGNHESITSNCHIKIAYAPNRVSTAEELSKMIGYTTIKNKALSISRRGVFGASSKSISYQEVKRPLLTAEEISQLKSIDVSNKKAEGGEMIIFLTGQKPIKGKQILYFTDEVFLGRSKLRPAYA